MNPMNLSAVKENFRSNEELHKTLEQIPIGGKRTWFFIPKDTPDAAPIRLIGTAIEKTPEIDEGNYLLHGIINYATVFDFEVVYPDGRREEITSHIIYPGEDQLRAAPFTAYPKPTPTAEEADDFDDYLDDSEDELPPPTGHYDYRQGRELIPGLRLSEHEHVAYDGKLETRLEVRNLTDPNAVPSIRAQQRAKLLGVTLGVVDTPTGPRHQTVAKNNYRWVPVQ